MIVAARLAAVAIAALVVALAGAARVTGRGHVEARPARLVAARALVFVDRADGGIDVRARPDSSTAGAPVATLAPGTGGFVRGALRALARVRRARGVGGDVPFTLARWSDGRLTLDDSATGSHVELRAFGGTNEAAFAALLEPRR